MVKFPCRSGAFTEGFALAVFRRPSIAHLTSICHESVENADHGVKQPYLFKQFAFDWLSQVVLWSISQQFFDIGEYPMKTYIHSSQRAFFFVTLMALAVMATIGTPRISGLSLQGASVLIACVAEYPSRMGICRAIVSNAFDLGVHLSYLNVHQDNIRTWMRWSEFLCQIVQDFLAVPNSVH